MSVRFKCPNSQCQKLLVTSEKHVGKKIRCPHCQTALRVPSVSDETTGKTLGEFKILRKLGEGDVSVIYEAVNTKTEERVALKVLSNEATSNPASLARFQREARSASSLNHPNIIRVHELGREGGRYFYAMEYVTGETLMDRLRVDGKFVLKDALNIVEILSKALKYAHEKSIIHRDIKPENVLMTSDGQIKLADLGLAKNTEEDRFGVTAVGVGLGTPYYMAPEQASDAVNVDHRADIYALGITLFHLLTGKVPFPGNSAVAVIQAHLQKPIPSGVEAGTELPEEIDLLIQKMCAKKAEERQQDYGELLEDLSRVRTGRPPLKPGQWKEQAARKAAEIAPAPATPIAMPTVPSTKGLQVVIWAGIAVAVLLVLAAIVRTLTQ
ncbi:MAG: serine/threonine protein kinase [Planctomycetes bacterium]|nr:serine/threonine protein kinase [Planctomycetota bacterium]